MFRAACCVIVLAPCAFSFETRFTTSGAKDAEVVDAAVLEELVVFRCEKRLAEPAAGSAHM